MSVIAAVDQKIGTCHEARRVARQKDGRTRNFFWLASFRSKCFGPAICRAVSMSPKRITKRSVSTAPGDNVLTRHILRRVIGRHRPGKLNKRTLGCAISRAARGADAAELRGNVNDAAATCANHCRQNSATYQKRPADIDRKYPVPFRQREVEYCAIRVVTGSAIYQNANGRKFTENCLHGEPNIGLASHVAMHRESPTACVRNRCSRCLSGFRIKIDANNSCSGLGKGERDRASDTVAGAGTTADFPASE